jgi:hypothetical protein
MASDADRAGAANGDRLAPAASASRLDRDGALRAVHVLEEALAAPAPRRARTWLHRVNNAVTRGSQRRPRNE